MKTTPLDYHRAQWTLVVRSRIYQEFMHRLRSRRSSRWRAAYLQAREEFISVRPINV